VFELKDSFAEVWDDNPGDSEDEEDDGDGEKEDPPHVDHQEVMLVEDVVGENTEQVLRVRSASETTSLGITGDFCGEKVAFGVYKFMVINSFLMLLHVIERGTAIVPELAVKEFVANCEAGNDSNNIENFTQKELDVIDSVLDLISLVAFLHKFFSNFLSVIAPDQRCYEVSFKTLPDSSRHLGEADESHEKERKPKIVSYGCFVFIRSLLICHTFGHTSNLERLGHMTSSMDPTKLVAVVITSMAGDGIPIQMVLYEDEDKSHHQNSKAHLMMKSEQPVVYSHFVCLEPFLKSVHSNRCSHFVGILGSLCL